MIFTAIKYVDKKENKGEGKDGRKEGIKKEGMNKEIRKNLWGKNSRG